MIVFAARQGAEDDMGRMPMQLVTVLIELISMACELAPPPWQDSNHAAVAAKVDMQACVVCRALLVLQIDDCQRAVRNFASIGIRLARVKAHAVY